MGGVLPLYGLGDGTFIEGQLYPAVVGNIAAGDLNGDGIVDLAVANNGRITQLLGQVAGGFEPENIDAHWIPCLPPDVSINDFNLDGIGDFILTGSHTIPVFFGREMLGLDPIVEHFAIQSWCPMPAVVADFNRDGRPDIAQATNVGENGEGSYVVVSPNQSNAKIRGDLTVTNVSAPASGMTGDVITVGWTVQNQLTTPITGKWTDAVYLSWDDQWDINDIRLGTLDFLGTLSATGTDDNHVIRRP